MAIDLEAIEARAQKLDAVVIRRRDGTGRRAPLIVYESVDTIRAMAFEITRLHSDIERKDAALRESSRFLDYFANDRTSLVGSGTPKSCLAQITAALGNAKEGGR